MNSTKKGAQTFFVGIFFAEVHAENVPVRTELLVNVPVHIFACVGGGGWVVR